MKKSNIVTTFILVFSFFVSFFMHLDKMDLDVNGIHCWRQSQTAWNIRNFYRHDGNILNPRVAAFNSGDNILRYEFPIMQWSIAKVQKVFGDSNFVMRVILFLQGVFSIIGIYLLFIEFKFSKILALAGALFFQFSPIFYFYTINPMPDNLALCGAIYYLLFIFRYFKNEKTIHLFLSAFSLMIATLAKVPFLMVAIVSVIYFFDSFIKNKSISRQLIIFTLVQLVFIFPAFLWYIWVFPTWENNGVVKGIFDNKISYDNVVYILKYYRDVMFPMKLMSPISTVFFLSGLILLLFRYKKRLYFQKYVIGLIGVTVLYLVLEFNMINTVHDYYMMPFMLWLYIVITYAIDLFIQNKKMWKYIILGVLVILTPIVAFTLNKNSWDDEKGFNQDLYKYTFELREAVPENELCIILNDHSIHFFSYHIDKMGYVFFNDYLPSNWVEDLIKNKNVKYMYSDSRKVDTSAAIIPYLDTLVLDAESIKVYKLKLPN